jgi:anti-sigma regulatory factor (Ser/Thr protein kinase)
MYELSLFILDLAQNSLTAHASLVKIWLVESRNLNRLTVTVADNGCGMTPETCEKALDPFMTTKQRRRNIGLGLPFFKQLVEMCGGIFRIRSRPGIGTVVTGSFPLDNVDQPPPGDVAGTVFALAAGNPAIDFRYTRKTDAASHVFDTRSVRATLGPDAEALWQTPEVLDWMRKAISDG